MAIERAELARLGALTRLLQIDQERAALLAAFPDLRRKARANGLGSPAVARKARRRFSAAAKRRMSAGMKKYWARRKNATSKAS